jgi:hypothetical protein
MRDALTRVALAGLILELGGCHLVDQRSFNAQAGRRPVPPVVAVVWPKTPGAYVTIQFAPGMEPDYRAALAVAVRRAMARKPDVLFSVATVVPISGGVEAQAASETAALERGCRCGPQPDRTGGAV